MRPQWRGGFAGFEAFTAALGVRVEPFQRTIARAALDGAERETVATLPRGNGKTALAALVALHHLVTVEGASIALGAASREQASVAYQAMLAYLAHPALDGAVVARAHELRAERGLLRVVSGRGDRAHGRTDSLMVLDELHVASPALLDAFETGLVKRADARLLVISTAAESTTSPLARLRERALAGDAVRDGALLDARAPGLRLLEWSLPEGDELTPEAAKSANPASWLTVEALAEQRARCTPSAWAAFHCCRPIEGRAGWLPEGSWSACKADYSVGRDERLIVAVDVGGTEASTVAVSVTRDLRVGPLVELRGDRAVLGITQWVAELIEGGQAVAELVFDPWRYQSEAARLEESHGVTAVGFPQTGLRLVGASMALHRAVTERRLRHPGDPRLDRHVAAAIARPVGARGWRLDQAERRAPVDLAIALSMAVERAGVPQPAAASLLGWL